MWHLNFKEKIDAIYMQRKGRKMSWSEYKEGRQTVTSTSAGHFLSNIFSDALKTDSILKPSNQIQVTKFMNLFLDRLQSWVFALL